MTYTQTFVVEDILADPDVKITAVDFSPSGALSLGTTLSSDGLQLTKIPNSNDYQGE